jgi:uncharacterized protein YjbI with pentapeptide repeats
MLLRILIAVAAIGAMGLTAFAQTPELNEAARKASAESIVKGKSACERCDLFQVDLSYQELPGLDLSGSRLRQADLSLSTFDKAKFTGANMSIVNAFGMRAEHSDFSKVDFADATLVGGSFGGSNFTSATFDNANLSGSDFETAKGLTQMQLNTACGDADTKLPKGLKLTACKN